MDADQEEEEEGELNEANVVNLDDIQLVDVVQVGPNTHVAKFLFAPTPSPKHQSEETQSVSFYFWL